MRSSACDTVLYMTGYGRLLQTTCCLALPIRGLLVLSIDLAIPAVLEQHALTVGYCANLRCHMLRSHKILNPNLDLEIPQTCASGPLSAECSCIIAIVAVQGRC